MSETLEYLMSQYALNYLCILSTLSFIITIVLLAFSTYSVYVFSTGIKRLLAIRKRRTKAEMVGGFIDMEKKKTFKAYNPNKDPAKIAAGEVDEQF